MPALTVDDNSGNLTLDPLMIDPDGDDNVHGTEDDNLRLSGLSPAIDTGSNNFAYVIDFLDLDDDGNSQEKVPMDLDSNVRIFAGLGGVERVDMGAYEYGAPSIKVATEDDFGVIPQASLITDAYPNPFVDHVTIGFDIASAGPVSVKVFDILGREIATLIDHVLPPGHHKASLHAPDLANGLYLFQVETRNTSSVRKLTRVQ